MDVRIVHEMIQGSLTFLDKAADGLSDIFMATENFLVGLDEQLSRFEPVEEPAAEDPLENAIKKMASNLNISEDRARSIVETGRMAYEAAVKGSAQKYNSSPYDNPRG